MNIKEIDAKSILRKGKRVDSWFITAYGMNFYRGCMHNCAYCDGRSEKYYVDGVFGEEITVKRNAIEVLERELNPARKRVPFKKCYMLLGGGVTDSYQPVDRKYEFSRQALELFLKYEQPVHILTKSTLVERDTDLIKQIRDRSGAIVSFSLSSADDRISSIFEPGVPSATARLETLRKLKAQGVNCGVFLMPVIPFISDTEIKMEETVRAIKSAGADFIIFGGLTLKPGVQKDYFMNVLKESYPSMEHYYNVLYRMNDEWGNGVKQYYIDISRRFYNIALKYSVPVRVPPEYFCNLLDMNSLVAVYLEHIDYLERMRGIKADSGYVAHKIATMRQPLMENIDEVKKMRGMDEKTLKIIEEVLETKMSKYYIKLQKAELS